MAKSSLPDGIDKSLLASRLTAGLAGVLLLATVAAADFATGAGPSLLPFYLLPLAIVTWFVGPRWGVAFSVLAAAVKFAVQTGQDPLGVVNIWNAGMWCGVCLCFCLLLGHIRTRDRGVRVVRSVQRTIIGTTIAACVLTGAGLILQQDLLARQAVRFVRGAEPANASSRAVPGPITGARAAKLLSGIVSRMPAARSASRPVLLGSRDPNGPSCVKPVLAGEITTSLPENAGDLDGGPGTKMGVLYLYDRRSVSNAQQDFVWHQTRLRTNLENQAALNQRAQILTRQLAIDASSLAAAIDAWTVLPADFTATQFIDYNDWPSYCLSRLGQSIAARDLAATRRWATEFAAAAFALEDLHRWLGFLAENHLAALDFQRLCMSLFATEGPKITPYDLQVTIGNFPAGSLGLCGLSNYYEVERQAETLYKAVGPEKLALVVSADPSPELLWVPPSIRDNFRRLGQELSPPNRRNWFQAARTPYERSYLVNMLYRAAAAGTIDALRDSLRRFDASNPNATIQQLMDVIMYRSHGFGGVEWPDRFQSPLLAAGAGLAGQDLDVFQAAARITNDFYQKGRYGQTNTLREALATATIDCVRSTDMIGAIHRNAGRPRFGYVWWCAGTSCHAVAAYLGRDADKTRTLILDGLDLKPQPEVWPEAYFQGHDWPANLQTNAPPYCAELYIRGLDNYVFAEGYIIRGPNAGTLAKSPIPYHPLRVEKSSKRVFNGPYPQ